MTGTLLDEVVQKNREIYDNTSSPEWYLAVYEAVHQGWEFINLGGVEVADRIARDLGLRAESHVIDVCAGQAAVSRYFATRYRCRISAVEWNPEQIRAIRRHLARTGLPIEPVQADATTWRPGTPADGAFSMDALMLTPDTAGVIQNVAQSLKPGAMFSIAVICGGRKITPGMRKFAWDIDGMIHLPDIGWYVEAFEAAGFHAIEAEDCTDIAVRTSEAMEKALAKNEVRIVDVAGPAVFRGWKDVGAVYLKAFRDHQLTYLCVRGRKRNR